MKLQIAQPMRLSFKYNPERPPIVIVKMATVNMIVF
jgi:hypothetical protein